MAGAKKTFNKVVSTDSIKGRFLPNPLSKDGVRKSFINPGKVLSETAQDLGDLFTPDIPTPEEETIIPLPNESVANLEARRRRAKKAGSGRSSTILTEGLGG